MILSAELLDGYDRCERRFAFNQKYDPKIISPLGVLYAAVEAGIVSSDPEQAAKDETMRIASRKDILLTEINKFTTVRHVGYVAGIIAVALQDRFGAFSPVPDTDTWRSGLFKTQSGKHHRIELVNTWDDDRLRACAHSWRVIGELAALEAPLTLTAVIIGPQRGGRRHSEWSKGLLHPVNKALRFAPRSAKKTGFNDSWEKVWREHQGEISTAKWLSAMKQDEVLDSLIISRDIAYNADDNRMVAARREMEYLAVAMEGSYERSPMRRSSCDETGRGACVWQNVCYSPTEASPTDFPELYQIRGTPDAERAECTSASRSGV
jgi:hypothetical protein